MKRKFIYVLTIAAAATFASCSNDSGKGHEGSDSTKTEGAPTSDNEAPSKGKYAVKSGIVTYDTETMGMKMPTTLYFDDYGKRECTEMISELEMMGTKVKMHNITITKDGYIYEIDMEKKTGKKMKANPNAANPANMDFSKLSEDMMKQMHISKGGSENVCGKDCEIYKMDDPSMKMKGTFAVWGNIPMKTTVDMGGMAVVSNATKVEENASVPAGKFDIPADIKITEF